jgi:predicted P-loop ATPase
MPMTKKEKVTKFPTPTYDAFNSPREHWPEMGKKGPKLSLANAIHALRYLLKDKDTGVRYDNWKQHYITIPPFRNDPTRQWLNEVHEEHKLFFSLTMFKNAKIQLSVKNQFHSQIAYYDSLKWDQVPRIETFVKECLKAEGTPLELCVIKMHLIASVRRVIRPGAAYDMCPCLIGKQGYMKSKMLSILYGEHNVLAEDISCKDVKVQSEKTRHGINCVELPETLGDGSKLAVEKVRAFITARFYKGVRDAYGYVENIRPLPKTFVIWHTPNGDQFLEDPTGNRRFIPIKIYDYIDEDWLRVNRDQIWAEIVELEEQGRSAYYASNPGIQQDNEKFPDIFLPEEFYEQAEALQRKHMKADVALISHESLLRDLIDQPFVIRGTKQTYVLAEDVRKYLGVSEERWNRKSENTKGTKSEEITAILKTLVWEKCQVWPRDNQRGYKLVKST